MTAAADIPPTARLLAPKGYPVDIRETISQSGLFDDTYYLARYQDIARAGADPLDHYIHYGEAEGRQPNAYFDPRWYRDQMAPDMPSGLLALLHYSVEGGANDLAPGPGFCPAVYRLIYKDIASAGVEPLRHFLTRGALEGRIAFPYEENREDALALARDLIDIHQSGLFLADWYKSVNFTLYGSSVDALQHYVLFGSAQGLNPNPYFDTVWYQRRHPDEIGDQHPLAHYVRAGWQKGYAPCADFDPAKYFAAHADLKPGRDEPLRHYLMLGRHEGRPFPQSFGAIGQSLSSQKSTILAGDPLTLYADYQPAPLSPPKQPINPNQMDLHWIIPDFAAGAGGHMTIFRMAHFLALAGHKQTFWIHTPSQHSTADEAFHTLQASFQHLMVDIHLLSDAILDIEADAVIATDCFSVWPAMAVRKVHRRFYFVQDHESQFHPMGSRSLVAEASYGQDIDCICASTWLAQLMEKSYGRWARPFHLAADPNTYFPPAAKRDNEVPRIAVYARYFTARRLVELALLALDALAKRGITFEVDFFGAPLDFDEASFPFIDHGVTDPDHLAEIFRGADAGLVFSGTNYSLVPQEMMACGLPIVEFDGPNTRAIFPDGVVTFAKPEITAIANALESLLQDEDGRHVQASRALKWVSGFSWRQSAELIEAALKDRLSETASAVDPIPLAPKLKTANPKASVVIPTLNPGAVFEKVLAKVMEQRCPFDYEVLVIDSGSTDGTCDLVENTEGARLHHINKADFDHGDTRNLGVELTSGDMIAFLTHDALPANDRWLYMMVSGLDHFPSAAGAIGGHRAWPDASPFTKRDLKAHFDLMASQPLLLDKNTDRRRYKRREDSWMQLLHFYSDNNSIMRRSVWQNIPYRQTKFGEDQLWAYDIIAAGHAKLYLPRAAVFHSHDYDATETEERSFIETAFFKHFFGYELMPDEATLSLTLSALNHQDELWALSEGLDEEAIATRLELNKARLKGQLRGTLADTSGLF